LSGFPFSHYYQSHLTCTDLLSRQPVALKKMNPANPLPDQTKHIISHYDAALDTLKNDVITMFNLADRLFQTAFAALSTHNSEFCDQVILENDTIETLEKQVDQEGLSLLIRFHPVATDMRQVVSAMRVGTNLQRIADQSAIIAQKAKNVNSRPVITEVERVEPAYRDTYSIFVDSMRAFTDSDCRLAESLKARQKALEVLTTEISEELVRRATVEAENVPTYVDLIFVSRALKRIGEYATNIGEDSFWRDQATGISES
jgi:phosphate transport system protein